MGDRNAHPFAACKLVLHQRQQLTPIGQGIWQRIKASNQEGVNTQVVVLDQRIGHLLGRAHQRCGVGAPTCFTGNRRP